MGAKAIVSQLAGIAGLAVLLFLLFSVIENTKGIFNGFATSVSSCPVCPENKFTSVTMSVTNDIKGSTKKLIQFPVEAVQCTPAENAPEPKMQHFVYVYDLGCRYTTDVLALKPSWYDIQYDGDKHFTRALMESNAIRTADPEIATLFYVPFYAARFTLYYFEDLEHDMAHAINKTSEVSSACQLLWQIDEIDECDCGSDSQNFTNRRHGSIDVICCRLYFPPTFTIHIG